VVLAMGPGTTAGDGERAAAAFRALCREGVGGGGEAYLDFHNSDAPLPPPPEAALSPRDAFFAATQRVPLQRSVGRACAELLCPYPPGVPLLFPGELITAQAVEALRATRAAGGAVVGASDSSLATVLVACRGEC
jgi:arginine/lysine/ornithine decarboxylase